MLSNVLKELPLNRPVILNNSTCPYCGIQLTSSNGTKEHVIGRRFVPKGALDGNWNLIVRACDKCNSTKSDLEDDISAITLAGRAWFESDDFDQSVLTEVLRKSEGSISQKTGKPVKHSQENLDFEVAFGPGAALKFNLVSPPQIDRSRSFELARMQMLAFFYFITFDRDKKRGGFWPEGFHPLSEAHHGDWGNTLQVSFMSAVASWEPRWIGNTADGFFKSIIRRHPHEECWSWAVEWNKNYRLVGFFGSRESAQIIVNTFPSPDMKVVPTKDKASIGVRKEVKLAERDDLLFAYDNGKRDDENTNQ